MRVKAGSFPHTVLSVACAAPLSASEFAGRLERRELMFDDGTLRCALSELARGGLLAKPERGSYILTRAGEEALEEAVA